MEQISKRLMSWASIMDPGTLEQARMTAEMPFVFPHLALMPDAHLGKGATVGSVIPTLGAIMPAAVGVDIGCGMEAVRTQFTGEQFRNQNLSWLRELIEDVVPVSAGGYNQTMTASAARRVDQLVDRAHAANFDPASISPNWELQLGTLGSGNHFIEVSVDELDRVWLFLHSGSRGIGNKIAQRHIKIAQQQCAKRWISLPHPDLAYLVEGEPEFWSYIRELRWAQEFALLNRQEMMQRVSNCVTSWMGELTERQEHISCHHNFTQQETHFGKLVWLSRKGAIEATEGKPGLIPGSMGTASYIVTGNGNRLSLNSSPHGAGRNHSRSAARKLFTEEDLRSRMRGIEYSDSGDFRDEHPDAYKDIGQVMEDAYDLVDVKHVLHQLVNVKGA